MVLLVVTTPQRIITQLFSSPRVLAFFSPLSQFYSQQSQYLVQQASDFSNKALKTHCITCPETAADRLIIIIDSQCEHLNSQMCSQLMWAKQELRQQKCVGQAETNKQRNKQVSGYVNVVLSACFTAHVSNGKYFYFYTFKVQLKITFFVVPK